MTNLKDLLAKATVPPTQKLVKLSSSWETIDENGNPVTYDFDFFIVDQISFAASDRIYLGSRSEEDKSAAARVIVERVRLGETGDEQLTLEQVHNLHPSLGWALISAVQAFDKEKADTLEAAKKLRQEMNSGTNSSSTESAERQ